MTIKSAFARGRRCACLIAAICAVYCGIPEAAEPPATGESALLARYPLIRGELERNQFGAPVYLESAQAQGSLRVDMYGTFDAPFAAVSDALGDPENWCDIAPLDLNIKACVFRKTGNRGILTLYSGRKSYQPPSEAYPLDFVFRTVSLQPAYLQVTLAAAEGPLGTRDHRILLEATPLDPGRTLLHFSYAYRHGPVARLAIKAYFATLARDKVGFSTVAAPGGKRFYVDGVRGALERNTVRYYLALETYLDTLKYPQAERFERRIGRWYDLTARYPRQLKELERASYLAEKRSERLNQLQLQRPGAGR